MRTASTTASILMALSTLGLIASLTACGVKSPPKYTYPGSEKPLERRAYPPMPEGYDLPDLKQAG